jgi:IS5 family transposase
LLGSVPRLVAADAAFYSARNEAAAKAKGVKRVFMSKREQKKRWFRNGQKWRTGCEGRSASPSGDTASAVAATRDLSEWTAGSGLGAIADKIINIGRAMEKQADS